MGSEAAREGTSSYNHYLGGLQETEDRDNFCLQVGELLYGINMQTYIPVFQEHNIGMDLFLALTEEDLGILGVKDTDIPAILTSIKCLRPKSATTDTHLQDEPEPKMSMRNLVAMQCHSAKQLIRLKKIIAAIEDNLKENKFSNTLVDTDCCAAQAMHIVCTELVRQANILSDESKKLRDKFLKIGQGNREAGKEGKLYLWTGIFAMSVTPLLLILWRSLRK